MTEEETLELHKTYTEQHKTAFRTAFDFLKAFWPPKNDPEWFRTTVNPEWERRLLEAKDDGNDLAHRLLMEVYAYLDVKAGEMGNANRPD